MGRRKGSATPVTRRRRPPAQPLIDVIEEARACYEHAPCGFHSLDSNGAVVSVNETELRWLGYGREELLGRSIVEILTPESVRVFLEHFPRFRVEGEPCGVELELRRKDGSTLPVLIACTAVRDESGRLILARSSVIDLTERRRSEAALRDAEAALERVVEGEARFDTEGRYTYVSAAYAALIGYAPEELLGKSWELTVPPGDRELVMTALREMQAGGKAEVDARAVRKDGSIFDKHGVLVRAMDSQGRVTSIYCFMRDVSERRRAEQALREKTAELARANTELGLLATVAAHQVQEPLRKILVFGELLEKAAAGSLGDEALAHLRRMMGAAERMSVLVRSLSDLARLTGTRVSPRPVGLASVLREVLSELWEAVDKTKARIEVGELPVLLGDRFLIAELLRHLLSNALKFRRTGEVPRVRVWGREAGGLAELTVQDEGIGFDEKYLGVIFEPFQSLHGASEYEGAGVGLAVCRRIAALHGGSITARSAPGRGSTFIVRLPAASSR